MKFKSEAELKKFLLAKCKEAVARTEQKVHSIIDMCLEQFYNEFSPIEYIRTEQLLHSLVRSGIEPNGKNGYKARVYFDADALDYKKGAVEIRSTGLTGRMGYAVWDTDTILDVVMTGSYSGLPHGGYQEGTAIWSQSQKGMQALGGVYEMLERELKTIGVPIVKK